ncbi:MAG: hypothetical protein Q7V63_01335 [Gammaproteobacteria bacterium]|nr:hypothetical protein [Gammaproteobacteria bacterium]
MSYGADPAGDWTTCFQATGDTGAYCAEVVTAIPRSTAEDVCPEFCSTTPATIFKDAIGSLAQECNMTIVPLNQTSACNFSAPQEYEYGQKVSSFPPIIYIIETNATSGSCAVGGVAPHVANGSFCFDRVLNGATSAANALYPEPLPPAPEKRFSDGEIAGMVGGGILGMAALAIGAALCRRRCAKKGLISLDGEGAAYVPVPVPNEP